MEPTPQLRQALAEHLQAWLEEADNARKLLNHALWVQDWLVARTRHATRIKDAQTKLEQPPLPKPSDDAESEAKDSYNDQQKERTKLENELSRLQKEMVEKYRAAPADKSEHAELKALRPLDKSGLKACPAETLPSVGKLYAGKGAGGQISRFLAISDWAAHEAGQREADRLRAALVAEAS
jgi:hypothetical protein